MRKCISIATIVVLSTFACGAPADDPGPAGIPDLTKGEGPSMREAAKDDWPLDFAPGYSRIKGWIYPGLKIGMKGTREWSRDQRASALLDFCIPHARHRAVLTRGISHPSMVTRFSAHSRVFPMVSLSIARQASPTVVSIV
jgi:hypothetical protein